MSEIEPNSPMARAKARPKPPSTAGQIEGSTTVKKMRALPAPSVRAADSLSRSKVASTG